MPQFKDLFETILGWIIFSLPFWDKFISRAGDALHGIVLITGALLGIHGVWRIIIRPKIISSKRLLKRRESD